ncbi:MAG: 2-C-methyl-D-erythritol 4-phosphate cytidylyltransferase [Muribaculaceae bacterium]|nr:2-C-methyl-D-erythritol 4-phosphate cytidylyltransferase [Muribaculaceae bacterium]MDE6770089.1 2-C-methyl-D-erythritol 4-phosphate cytidylyltransferase [Muribaculaceae bacterium]
MDKYAVIVAGGEGTRLGGGLPKQFRELNGRPVLWWSLKAFHDEDPSTRLRVVLHPGFFEKWQKLFLSLPEEERFEHTVVAGGSSRTGSVKNGIEAIPASSEALIAVHDAARPLVSVDMIARGWEAAAKAGGAVPAVPVTDSLRHLTGTSHMDWKTAIAGGELYKDSEAVDRSEYVAVQTPQVFRADLLKGAYALKPDAVFSDDAAAYEAAGGKPVLFEGSPLNMKVTNPGDLEIASLLLSINKKV